LKEVNRTPSPLLVEWAAPLEPGRALDLACGMGRNSLWLAQRGWDVTAVDSSQVAIEALGSNTAGPRLSARLADLERHEFLIEPAAWDLIADFFYLQRDLWPSIREGVRPGGLFVATIHLFDHSPEVRPMNPEFLLRSGELADIFRDWTILHYAEARPDRQTRMAAELVARRNA
jgi:SAM-dependent methyltransferase